MPHELKLTQGALSYARELLQSIGWAKTTTDIMLGGKLLVDVLPEVAELPVLPEGASAEQIAAHNKAVLAWIAKPVDPISITDKQRDAMKRAVDFVVEKAQLRPGPQALTLLTALGYDAPE